jgi:hypothetical protein
VTGAAGDDSAAGAGVAAAGGGAGTGGGASAAAAAAAAGGVGASAEAEGRTLGGARGGDTAEATPSPSSEETGVVGGAMVPGVTSLSTVKSKARGTLPPKTVSKFSGAWASSHVVGAPARRPPRHSGGQTGGDIVAIVLVKKKRKRKERRAPRGEKTGGAGKEAATRSAMGWSLRKRRERIVARLKREKEREGRP